MGSSSAALFVAIFLTSTGLVVPLGVPPEAVVLLGVLVAAVLVLLVVVVAVVLAVAAGMGNSIPAVCNILPKLVSNLAGLLVDLRQRQPLAADSTVDSKLPMLQSSLLDPGLAAALAADLVAVGAAVHHKVAVVGRIAEAVVAVIADHIAAVVVVHMGHHTVTSPLAVAVGVAVGPAAVVGSIQVDSSFAPLPG